VCTGRPATFPPASLANLTDYTSGGAEAGGSLGEPCTPDSQFDNTIGRNWDKPEVIRRSLMCFWAASANQFIERKSSRPVMRESMTLDDTEWVRDCSQDSRITSAAMRANNPLAVLVPRGDESVPPSHYRCQICGPLAPGDPFPWRSWLVTRPGMQRPGSQFKPRDGRGVHADT
jgi:hypothetical protein